MPHMTQEEALAELQALFPEKAAHLRLERDHSIGKHFGYMDVFYIWDHSGGNVLLAKSDRSWNHAVAIVKSSEEDIWPEDHSPIVEVSHV